VRAPSGIYFCDGHAAEKTVQHTQVLGIALHCAFTDVAVTTVFPIRQSRTVEFAEFEPTFSCDCKRFGRDNGKLHRQPSSRIRARQAAQANQLGTNDIFAFCSLSITIVIVFSTA